MSHLICRSFLFKKTTVILVEHHHHHHHHHHCVNWHPHYFSFTLFSKESILDLLFSVWICYSSAMLEIVCCWLVGSASLLVTVLGKICSKGLVISRLLTNYHY